MKLKDSTISPFLSLQLIHLLRPVFIFAEHRSAIPPSGQMHPNVESMIIQTPSVPQNECSQTATKRRAIQ